jgi:SAM-dependent methyltransferase
MARVWFDATVAETYDDDQSFMFKPEVIDKTVAVLHELARGGPALEFAIGTGRIALPLIARGTPVVGIELSEAMVARLRTKPGGDEQSIPVAIGDIANDKFDQSSAFSLVYLVFNTITNLTSQEAQVDCFQNAADQLAPGGVFVVETFVPRLQWLPPGQRYVPFQVSDRHVGIDEYDIASQSLISHHTNIRDGVADQTSMPFRYVWPSELDLMARLADMRLRERWSGWDRTPFTAEGQSHVSVWEKVQP